MFVPLVPSFNRLYLSPHCFHWSPDRAYFTKVRIAALISRGSSERTDGEQSYLFKIITPTIYFVVASFLNSSFVTAVVTVYPCRQWQDTHEDGLSVWTEGLF